MYSEINDYVLNLCDFSTQELEVFNRLLEYKNVKRKSYLLKPNEISTSEIFIKKGCLRSFYVNQLGAEISLNFGTENSWVNDIESFNNQKPSMYFIETLEASELFFLTYDNKIKLLKEIPKFEKVFRLVVQNNFIKIQDRLIKMVTAQARERYLDFIKNNPSLLSRVTQLQIATYLGITPEFLSKMKHELISENII